MPFDGPLAIKLAIGFAFVLLACYISERAALQLMLCALGNRNDIPTPHRKKLLDLRSRGDMSELDEALLQASAFPAALTAGFGAGGTLGSPPGLDLIQEAFVIIVMLSAIILAATYAIMISGWKRCRELLDDGKK